MGARAASWWHCWVLKRHASRVSRNCLMAAGLLVEPDTGICPLIRLLQHPLSVFDDGAAATRWWHVKRGSLLLRFPIGTGAQHKPCALKAI